MIDHCICQSLAGCSSGKDGFHGGLLRLYLLFQFFSFIEQQFEILSLYFRQDSGSLLIAMALGMQVRRPVQRRTNARSIGESLVAQSMDLLGRRSCRTAQKFLHFALDRHQPAEFRLDSSCQLRDRNAHCLSNTGGGGLDVF